MYRDTGTNIPAKNYIASTDAFSYSVMMPTGQTLILLSYFELQCSLASGYFVITIGMTTAVSFLSFSFERLSGHQLTFLAADSRCVVNESWWRRYRCGAWCPSGTICCLW